MPDRQAHARALPRTVRLLPGFRFRLWGCGLPCRQKIPQRTGNPCRERGPFRLRRSWPCRTRVLLLRSPGRIARLPVPSQWERNCRRRTDSSWSRLSREVGNAHLVPSSAVREVDETSCSRVEAKHNGVAHIAGVEVLVVVEGQAENESVCRGYRLDAGPIGGDPVDLPRLSPAPDVAVSIDRDPLGVAESRLAEYAVEEDLGALQRQYGLQGLISPLSGGDLRRHGLVWISKALLGHQRVTARVSGVPVVRISSKLLVELCVFVQLVPVQADAQPRAIGDLDGATLVLEHAPVDDVVL